MCLLQVLVRNDVGLGVHRPHVGAQLVVGVVRASVDSQYRDLGEEAEPSPRSRGQKIFSIQLTLKEVK